MSHAARVVGWGFVCASVFLCHVFVGASPVEAARARPADFPLSRALTPAGEVGESGVFVLDASVYRALNHRLSNVRLFDSAGAEVAFSLSVRQVPDTLRHTVPVRCKQLAFNELNGNRIQVVFERDTADSAPSWLVIRTPATDFDKRVSVWGSDDLNRWRALGRNEPIFDYHRFIDSRSTRVAFEQKLFRYYRIQVEDVTSLRRSPLSEIVRGHEGGMEVAYERFLQQTAVLRIEGVEFFRTVQVVRARAAARTRWPVSVDTVYGDTVRKVTRVVFRSDRQPLSRLFFRSGTRNYMREILVEAGGDTAGCAQPSREADWRAVGQGTVSAVDAGGVRSCDSVLELDGTQRFPWYRIGIVNDDNRPLSVESVGAEGTVHEIVFFGEGAAQLTLCYGGTFDHAPSYDIDRVLARTPNLEHTRWSAGPEQVNPVKKRFVLLSGRTALTIAILLMVVVLAIALGGALRKMQTSTGRS